MSIAASWIYVFIFRFVFQNKLHASNWKCSTTTQYFEIDKTSTFQTTYIYVYTDLMMMGTANATWLEVQYPAKIKAKHEILNKSLPKEP